MLDADRYQQMCDHFQEVVRLDVDRREERLKQLNAEDPELAKEVSRLLAAEKHADESSFLDFSFSNIDQTFLDASHGEKTEFPSIPAKIGEYEIYDKLGSGGMGVVYRAYHPQSDRQVAIKLIRDGKLSDSEQIERFRREAKAAAQMRHPNIVPVFEVGQANGCDYFTMALVHGNTLQEQLNDEAPGQRQIAQMFLKLAQAIEYAHSKGVIHRDIKPANIILEEGGEPQLMDFGLAKRTNIEESQTRTGQILGTVRFMAPEQITNAKDADFRTDLYGLGAVMYHSLCGVPPFSGGEMLQVFDKIQNRLPVTPRVITPELDHDLDFICMKCLQKDRQDRYQTAKELAADLERYLGDEPLEKNTSTWRQSLSRVLKHQETPSDLPSARAAWWVSIVTLIIHLWIFFTFWPQEQNHWLLWSALICGFVCLSYVNFIFHWSRFWHLTAAERQSGIIQLASHVSFLCLFLINGPLNAHQPLSQFLAIYPPYFLIVGVALVAHVGFSGHALLQGAVFFPLSVLVSFLPSVGPLVFAVVGALVCFASYRDLRAVVEKSEKL